MLCWQGDALGVWMQAEMHVAATPRRICRTFQSIQMLSTHKAIHPPNHPHTPQRPAHGQGRRQRAAHQPRLGMAEARHKVSEASTLEVSWCQLIRWLSGFSLCLSRVSAL